MSVREEGGKTDDARVSLEVQKVAERAIRRLNLLEWVILAATALLALLGGAVTAFLANGVLGLPFRPTWMVASLVIFGVPAALTYVKTRRPEPHGSSPEEDRTEDGG